MVYRQLSHRQTEHFQRFFLPVAVLLLVGLLWVAYARPFGGTSIALPDYGRLSLSFIPNAGQSDAAVRYMAQTPGMSLFFTGDGLTFSGEDGFVRWQFVGAETAEIHGANILPGVANYLYGQDSGRWQTGLPTFGAVQYEGLYPGVDVAFGGVPGQVAAAFELAAGVAPELLQWQFEGAAPELNRETGGLALVDENGRTIMEFEPPLGRQQAWGEAALEAAPVAVTFRMTEGGAVTLAVAGYNRTDSLTIFLAARPSADMLFGFEGVDRAESVASNSALETFVTGSTNSPLFPTVVPLQADNAGEFDVFVTKYSADGDILFSTYLGGSDDDFGEGIGVDSAGNVILTGYTASTDFPLMNAIMADQPVEDTFVSKISADGSQLLFSTYLGGSQNDRDSDVAVNVQGDIFIAGRTFSNDFPLLDPIQGVYGGGSGDTYLSKISGGSYQLLFSTYLGGNDLELSGGIDLDQNGNVFVAGSTKSIDFPIVNTGIPQPQPGQDNLDVFISKIAGDGSSLLFSALFGGAGADTGNAVSVDPSANALVVGETDSIDFPVVAPIQAVNNGDSDVFITRVAGNGSSMLFSTYLGGHLRDAGLGVIVGGAGNVFLTGITLSDDFPQLNPLPGMAYPGFGDAFVARQSPAGNLVWSTYLGGMYTEFGNSIVVDSIGRPVVAGWTNSPDFPTANAFQPFLRDAPDGFVSRINHSGTVLEFSTYLGGGNGYTTPTDVTVSEIGGTAEPNPALYLLTLGLLVLLLVGVWVVNKRNW